jgi:hypothetical protein
MPAIYDFEVLKEGEYHRIIYKATKMPYATIVHYMVLALFPAGFLAYLAGFELVPGLWATGILALILGYLLFVGTNARRKGGEIKIGKHAVIVKENVYELHDISKIWIKNNQIDHFEKTVIIVDEYGDRKRRGVIREMRRNLAKVSYQVVIQYGSKARVIAKDLGETEANALLNKIVQLSDLFKLSPYSA